VVRTALCIVSAVASAPKHNASNRLQLWLLTSCAAAVLLLCCCRSCRRCCLEMLPSQRTMPEQQQQLAHASHTGCTTWQQMLGGSCADCRGVAGLNSSWPNDRPLHSASCKPSPCYSTSSQMPHDGDAGAFMRNGSSNNRQLSWLFDLNVAGCSKMVAAKWACRCAMLGTLK
jgi:hypothetical protein